MSRRRGAGPSRPPRGAEAAPGSEPGPEPGLEYEGLQGHIRALALPALETWENQYPDRDYTVRLEVPEFNCICPKTGLPDFATITIEYVPDRRCVELRSLKLYITAYRNVGIFHEHAVNRLLDDLAAALAPRRLEVRGIFGVRGGITTTVEARWTPRRRR